MEICGCYWTLWGIMTGVRDLMFDILDWDQGKFSLKMVVKNKRDGFIWELINVYGPAHQSNRGGGVSG